MGLAKADKTTTLDTKRAAPATGQSIHPVIDTLEMRMRCALLRDAGRADTPEEVIRRALDYASEAEQRISELSARVKLLESLAVTDELTGLLNRRGFQDMLYRNLASATRHNETGVLAFIDLDEFKQINDTYGHAAGDAVLRKIGQFLRRNIRTTDYAARLGGDEFALLYVRGEHARARERARELNEKLNGLVVPWEGHSIEVRASIGMASYDKDSTAMELLDLADRAMYRDKSRPRKKTASRRKSAVTRARAAQGNKASA